MSVDAIKTEPHCPICLGPLPAVGAECPFCSRLLTPAEGAYVAFLETDACKRCGEGESWTVKGPDALCIGQSWSGPDAQCEAEEMAVALNAAFELGRRSALTVTP